MFYKHICPEETGTNIASQSDKDDIVGDSEQIQLTNMQASGAPLLSIVDSWICKEMPIFVNWICNIRQSTGLERHSPAYRSAVDH